MKRKSRFLKPLEKLVFFFQARSQILKQPRFARSRKIIIAVFGVTVLLIGIAMIVLPGPALIVIPLGLGILGTEFMWAKHLLDKINHKTQKLKDNLKNRRLKRKKNQKTET